MMSSKEYLRLRVLKFIKENSLIPQNSSILISFSGGGDSVFLLEVLLSLKKKFQINRIGIALFDHGVNQDPDYNFIQRFKTDEVDNLFCIKLNLEMTNKSFEESAREARYNELLRLKEEYNYDFIATGHNFSDQAETVLYRFLTQGTIEGLIGIKVKREDNVIRPIICVSRKEIREYLDKNNIIYWNDPSNKDDNMCQRNKIRLNIIPLLEEINPSFERSIVLSSFSLQGIKFPP